MSWQNITYSYGTNKIVSKFFYTELTHAPAIATTALKESTIHDGERVAMGRTATVATRLESNHACHSAPHARGNDGAFPSS